MMYIEFGELVGNAFVNYLSKTGKHVLSLNTIYDYGLSVTRTLNEEGINAHILFTRSWIDNFFNKFSYFTLVESDHLVVLNNKITIDELVRTFSIHLNPHKLLAFIKEENVNVLLNSIKNLNFESNSFIDRLTYVQIQSFLEELYPIADNYCISFCKVSNMGKNRILAIAYRKDNTSAHNIILDDYTSNIDEPEKWITHLTEIFGKEYHRAFLEYGSSIVEEE